MSKRTIESIAYRGKETLRVRRGVHPDRALMRLESFLRAYGQPGDTGTVYDMETGKLYADVRVSTKKVISYIFK